MYVSDALRTIIKTRGSSQRKVGARMHISQPAFARVLKRGNPTLRVLCNALDGLGYDVVLIPKGTHLTDGSIIVRPREDKDGTTRANPGEVAEDAVSD
jgi:transcriptional regulator with XRE-family HTH domain